MGCRDDGTLLLCLLGFFSLVQRSPVSKIGPGFLHWPVSLLVSIEVSQSCQSRWDRSYRGTRVTIQPLSFG